MSEIEIKVDGKPLSDFEWSESHIMIDTNIMIFAHNRKSPKYSQASAVVLAASLGLLKVSLCPQILLEFYSAITNPQNASPVPELSEIGDIIKDFWDSHTFQKIFPCKNIATKAVQLAIEVGLSKAAIFDCTLAITAKENDIDLIWTDNVHHFGKIGLIKVENPLSYKWEIVETREL